MWLASTAGALVEGKVNPAQHLHAVRERIEDLDGAIQAFVPEDGRWDRLATQLGDLTSAHAASATRPPLYGVQVGPKDIIHVDGLPTGAGSDLPAAAFVGMEGSVIGRLRAAGALVTGKTVTTEFAFRAPGPTANPHALGHTPGGSSSGSAAAVAAGMVPLALGSQTIGSVIRPAAFCGVVGFKPSYGRMPIDGVVMQAPTFDTLGIFTRDVPGAALAASVVCDAWRGSRIGGSPADGGRRLPVLGVPSDAYLKQAEPAGIAAFDRQLNVLAEAGYEIRRSALLDDIEEINYRHQVINLVELARVHQELFAEYAERYRAESTEAIKLGNAIEERAYVEARAAHAAFRDQVHAEMDRLGVDVWISPSAPGPAPDSRDNTGNAAMNLPWTHAGLPTIGIPAGAVEFSAASGARYPLPVGLQYTARFGADEELLAFATALQELFVEPGADPGVEPGVEPGGAV